MKNEIVLIEEGQSIAEVFKERQMRLFKIGEIKVAVVRVGEEFYAFENHCPHSDYPLNEGSINYSNEVVCPWHNYMFSLKTGSESERRCGSLKLFAVWVNEQNKLVVEL